MSAGLNKLAPVGVLDEEESMPRVCGDIAPASADPAACPACFGTGMEVVPVRGARRCHCRTSRGRAGLIEAARILRRYNKCMLSNYRPADGNGSQLRAFSYVHRLAHYYPAVDRGLLGASKPTDWVRDTMMQVINARYNEKRLTIFTTNYTDDRRSAGDETLEERIGVRLRSRLYEMCRTVVVDGADYRRRFDG